MKITHDPKQNVLVSPIEIDAYRKKMESVVEVDGYLLQFDEASERRMRLAFAAGEPVTWRMADNSEHTFTNAEFGVLINSAMAEAGRVIAAAFVVARDLKEKEVVTLRDLESAPWPSSGLS